MSASAETLLQPAEEANRCCTGSKYEKAARLGLTVLSVEEFMSLIKGE